jgi:hypothetical protein
MLILRHQHGGDGNHCGGPIVVAGRSAGTSSDTISGSSRRGGVVGCLSLLAGTLLFQLVLMSDHVEIIPGIDGSLILVTTSTATVKRKLPEEQPSQQDEEEEESSFLNQYSPGPAEKFVIENPSYFGFNTTGETTSAGCRVWQKEMTDGTTHKKMKKINPMYQELRAFRRELKEYARRVQEFEPIGDLRLLLEKEEEEEKQQQRQAQLVSHGALSSSSSSSSSSSTTTTLDFCKLVELHPDGIQALFPSGQLSQMMSHSSSKSGGRSRSGDGGGGGFVEPLLPPMRHPAFCDEGKSRILDLTYLVHDFGALCRKLKRHSRIVLIDMGASLNYHHHADDHKKDSQKEDPMTHLIHLFTKFGFPFDHIYAYEIKHTAPAIVFGEKLPVDLMAAYHWINVGVSAEPGHRLNPFTTLLSGTYNEDDIVIVKLDIDTPFLEIPLARQVAENAQLGKLIDHFYFEHHVHLEELARPWSRTMQGSVQESLELFYKIRQNGVAAHFWV